MRKTCALGQMEQGCETREGRGFGDCSEVFQSMMAEVRGGHLMEEACI